MCKPQESTDPGFWDGVIGLEEFEVVHYCLDEERHVRRMTVVPRMSSFPCPHCQTLCRHVNQTRDRERIHDLPIGEQSVELRVRVPQCHCRNCGHFFTPTFQSLAAGAHATDRFLHRCADLIRVSDIANAAKYFHVPEKTLEDWYYHFVTDQQARHAKPGLPIRSLGIDELSQKKGLTASSR